MGTQKGFTIVELLIVIVIIGILSAIAVVVYNGVQNRAKTAQYISDVTTIVKKAELYPQASGTGLYPLASYGPDIAAATTQTDAGKILTAGINTITESKLPSNVVIFAVLTDTSTTPTNAQATIAVTNSPSARGYFVRYCATGKGMYIYYPDATAATTATALSRTVGMCP
jgi:prepilin-type N-terminal cleavage/methylation domain-containing protein